MTCQFLPLRPQGDIYYYLKPQRSLCLSLCSHMKLNNSRRSETGISHCVSCR